MPVANKARTATRVAGSAPDAAELDPRRERILNAAFALLLQRGYSGVSTLDIATRAKVSKRELYALFRSKQAILAAGIAARARRMRVPIELPVPHDRPSLAATLSGFGAVMLREVTDPHVTGMYRLAVTESERSPEVAATLDATGRGAIRAALIALLDGAQAEGLLAPGNTTDMAALFFGVLFGDVPMRLLLRVIEPPTPEDVTERARKATAALLQLHGMPRNAT